MIQFLTDHVDLVNAALNLTMVVIWIAYLQIFLVSHLRQSRSVIHIDLGLADGSLSRCLVTNLSSGAIYVQGIAADLGRDGRPGAGSEPRHAAAGILYEAGIHRRKSRHCAGTL